MTTATGKSESILRFVNRCCDEFCGTVESTESKRRESGRAMQAHTKSEQTCTIDSSRSLIAR